MKTYLSFGGGVNSTALALLLLSEGETFEAVFADTGAEYPETYSYLAKAMKCIPITIVKPKDGNLVDYAHKHKMVPSNIIRWCTRIFKLDPILAYYKKPCIQMIGIDAGESHRARMSPEEGVENYYPLVERGIDRQGCIDIINRYGLPIPRKSGCYICPFQTISQWKALRKDHTDLWCKALNLERRNIYYRRSQGKEPMYLYSNRKPLEVIVNEAQGELFEEYKPPCYCGR